MKPLTTLLVDTERGSTTVRDLIRSEWSTDEKGVRSEKIVNPEGTVIVEHAPTLEIFEKTYWRIRKGEYNPAPDVVVIDTLSALATTHRHTVIMKRTGIAEGSVFTNMLKLGSEQRDWGTASDNLIMILRQYRGLNLLTIINSHERFREDDTTKEKKIGPAVNAMLLADIMDFTDDAFRLSAIDAPQKVENVTYPKGTRFLRMTQSDTHFTKIRVAPKQKVPDLLPDPDLWKMKEVMGAFMPSRLLIFGSRGAGKTRYACSFSDPALTPLEKKAV